MSKRAFGECVQPRLLESAIIYYSFLPLTFFFFFFFSSFFFLSVLPFKQLPDARVRNSTLTRFERRKSTLSPWTTNPPLPRPSAWSSPLLWPLDTTQTASWPHDTCQRRSAAGHLISSSTATPLGGAGTGLWGPVRPAPGRNCSLTTCLGYLVRCMGCIISLVFASRCCEGSGIR